MTPAASEDEILLVMYEVCQQSRWWATRRFPFLDIDELLSRAMLGAVEAVRAGTVITDPPRYMRGIVHFTGITIIHERQRRAAREAVDLFLDERPDDSLNPEERAIAAEEPTAAQVIEMARPEDRELLTRVFLLEQDRDQVVVEMGISPKQFSNERWRAQMRLKKILLAA